MNFLLECFEGQGFGGNANPSYASGGLKGHTGIDTCCGYGTDIHSAYDGYVYKVITPQNTGDGFTGVFMIVDDGVELFEYLVGHCNPTVSVDTFVKKGDVIGTEANHGTVYIGNILITLAMQKAGDQRGSHRHNQKRAIFKTKSTNGTVLSTLGSQYMENGFYYQIWDYKNGYNGCINPLVPIFSDTILVGSNGYRVACLQRFLLKQGCFIGDTTGYFGPKTMAAVIMFQRKNNIFPPMGIVGPKTLAKINEIYLSPGI